MCDEEEAYCRLCAEPTTKDTLISPDEDAGINSKIKTKMLWINIDVTTTNLLPKSICFSCFDALERTWQFLHNVRTAQNKLNEIFLKNSDIESPASASKIDQNLDGLIGKPLNVDWEVLEKQEIKPDIDDLQEITVDPSSLINLDSVKIERLSTGGDHRQEADDINLDADDDTNHGADDIKDEANENIKDEADDFLNTTDSDAPLYMTARKIKSKKKKRKDIAKSITLCGNPAQLGWDDYMCRCAVCDAQCMNVMSLRLHSLQIHGCCCSFKCSECGKVANNFKSFVNHARLHSSVLRLCCEFCSKHYSVASHLNKHKNNDHHNVYRMMCQICGVNFDTDDQLQDHINAYIKNNRKRAPKSKKGDSLLKCEHCDKEFKSRSNLKQHKLVHTNRNRDYACHVCGKLFYTNGTLYTHILTHDEKKRYKCDICGLAFRARGNLTAHSSLHSGVKPFVCEQCGKSFRSKRHLKSHSIVHTDLMPYTCQYCNKTFRFKTRLNLHLRQHTGAKPYRCELCVRDFTNGSNFKKHMMRRHNIDTSSRKRYHNLAGNESKSADGSEVETNQT